MQTLIRIAATVFLLGIPLGCNTSDALTPQVDVGVAPPAASSPINQADLDAMSNQTVPVTSGTLPSAQPQSVQAQTLQAQAAGVNASSGPAPGIVGDDYVDPPGSLEAQAGRLGLQPQQNSTVATQPLSTTTGAQAAQDFPAATQQQEARLPAASQAAGGVTIRFLPIIGAPVAAVTPLSKQLGTEARARGITIKSGSDPTSQHILKGYFSAFADGGNTTVTYIWDVLDASGNRLHRIQGQDSLPTTGAEPWASIPATTMQAIATRTIADYLTWRQSNPG